MTILGKRIPLPIIPAVNPLEDSTQLDTIYFTASDKVRFQEGKLRKIKGWQRVFSPNEQRIIGAARNIFSFRDSNSNPVTMIGTSRSLYALVQDSSIYNVTPLLVTTNPIPNAFTTEYNDSAVVDVTTTSGSNVVTLNMTQYLNSNETLTISGVGSAVNGIPAANFNNKFNVFIISNNELQINVGAAATSSGSVAVTMTWSTSYLYATIDDYGMMKGDRIGILASSDVGNIADTSINIEHIISNAVDSDVFVFQTDTTATSLVIAGGGADTTIQYQVPPGNINESAGYGYGGGQYGVGIYGNALPFTNQDANTGPRIWSMDKWTDASGADFLILTPGDIVGSADGAGSNLYMWPITNVPTTSIFTAPVLITDTPTAGGAPMFVQWVFTSDNVVCTLGGAASNSSPPTASDNNYFAASDVGQISNWTPGPSSFAFATFIDQAGSLISQASARDIDLVFTEDEVYRLEFIGPPTIWFVRKLLTTDGIMAPKARAEIEDAVLWMGKGDFFVFDGQTLGVLPNNTVKRYVFDNINDAQSAKCFAYANTLYNEVWFFYPAGQDEEPNNYVMYNYKEKNWTIGTMPRTASEEPLNINTTPYMIESNFYNTLAPTSIQSYFLTAGTDPLTTVMSSTSVSITLPVNCYFAIGDYINISGAVLTNGISAAHINGIRQITGVTIGGGQGYGSDQYGKGIYGESPVTEDTITFTAGGAASSSGTGGGSVITMGTAIIGIDIGNTRLSANELVNISGAPGVGGIPQANVNQNNAPIRALVGTILQINDTNPSTVFATSSQIITDVSFSLLYLPSDRLFQQEVGLNDYNPEYVYGQPGSNPAAPMLSYAQTNMAQIGEGDDTGVLYSVYPDTNQQGNLTLVTTGRLYAQSPIITPTLAAGPVVITPQTTKVDLMFIARQRQYYIQSFELNGDFLIGNWFEEVKPSSTR